MLDYMFPLPSDKQVHDLHRWVYDLLKGQPRPLYRVEEKTFGGVVIVRSSQEIVDELAQPLRTIEPHAGSVVSFKLRASVTFKQNGKRVYVNCFDHGARIAWLDRKSRAAGFEVLDAKVQARKEVMKKGDAEFAIDDTDFEVVARITDAAAFSEALRVGIGPVGRAYGRGMILVTKQINEQVAAA
jgi:CRISPR-associated protein Cas6/Cse3/CasE subtype I-E